MKQNAVGEMKARTVAWRYGHPARGLKVIGVAGSKGKTTTALLLNELLLESGAKVAVFTNQKCSYGDEVLADAYDTSAEALFKQLQAVKKKGAYYVIIEVTEALLRTHALPILPLEMSIVTSESESARALLEHHANSSVIPTGFDTEGLRVAPHQLISFGTDEASEAQITRVNERRKGTEVDLVIDHQTKISVATYLVGQANAMNVAAAVSAAYVLAIGTEHFEEGVARLEHVPGNYEYLETPQALYDAVVDGACTAHSIELVLTSAKKLAKRRLLVVADSTVPSDLYPIMSQIADRLVVVGNGPELPGTEMVASLQEAADVARRAAKKQDLLLFVGAEVSAVQADGTSYAQKLIGETQTDEQ
mgnify:CR=1 FL=1